ncbi:hypothetical protein U1Q18_020776 [Sarracenia purpurea var. burkii]
MMEKGSNQRRHILETEAMEVLKMRAMRRTREDLSHPTHDRTSVPEMGLVRAPKATGISDFMAERSRSTEEL